MASAAQSPIVSRINLPSGDTDGNRRAFLSEKSRTVVQWVEMVPSDQGGEVAVATELGELPLGTKEIYVQHRMAGDYYCFIEGKRQVAAIGDTRAEAFQNALKLAA